MNDSQTKTKRGLSDSFFNDLKKGLLKPLLSFVKADNTLMLAIRDDYINIYYRGGNLLKLSWVKDYYKAEFNPKYAEAEKRPLEAEEIFLTKDKISGLPKIIKKGEHEQVRKWLDNFSALKQTMDIWLTTKRQKLEREFQQLVVRENNFSPLANKTDYFIVDIEVDDHNACFDLLAAKWPATQQDRKKDQIRLAFIEMKYGENSLTGESGLTTHLGDLAEFIKNPAKMSDLRQTIEGQLTQLNELGLLKHHRPENRDFEVTEEKPEVIVLLATYPPQSQILPKLLEEEKTKAEFERYAQDKLFDLKFHWPHSAGYGLFRVDMIPLECFKERLNSLMSSEKTPKP